MKPGKTPGSDDLPIEFYKVFRNEISDCLLNAIIEPLDNVGWVKNVVDSSRFDGIDTNRFPCCRFDMPEVDLHETYSAPGQFRVG